RARPRRGGGSRPSPPREGPRVRAGRPRRPRSARQRPRAAHSRRRRARPLRSRRSRRADAGRPSPVRRAAPRAPRAARLSVSHFVALRLATLLLACDGLAALELAGLVRDPGPVAAPLAALP